MAIIKENGNIKNQPASQNIEIRVLRMDWRALAGFSRSPTVKGLCQNTYNFPNVFNINGTLKRSKH
jgi:hypothetical protein